MAPGSGSWRSAERTRWPRPAVAPGRDQPGHRPLLALHRRWGQEAPDAEPYSSYTEEEFHLALDRWKTTGSPEIFVFFKHDG